MSAIVYPVYYNLPNGPRIIAQALPKISITEMPARAFLFAV